MEETRKRRWLIVLFFGLIASLFAGFIYTALTGPRDPRYRRIENAAAGHRREMKRRLPADAVTIILPVGERVRVDKNVMIYRGLENKMAQIDVFITDLDPQTPYRHAVSKSDAETPIRLGGQPFQLESITAAKLKLKRVKN
jgi:hypothetical protein